MTRRLASTVRDDAGFILIEVLVSAALLVLIAAAVFTTLADSDRLAGDQGRRAMAANMAQAEIERIRSLPIEDVANLRGRKEIVPDPSRPEDKYYLTASSKWVTDGSDEPDCSTRSGGLDYMRVTAMVAPVSVTRGRTDEEKAALARRPVVVSTIVTPAARSSSTTNGSLSVKVNKADAKTGVAGLMITISGPQGTFQEATNGNGCVVFPFVPAGPYQLKFNRTGWVNQNSVADVDDPVNVLAGQTTKVSYLYDLGGTTRAAFYTVKPAFLGLASEEVPSRPNAITLFNNDQTPGPITEDMPDGSDVWPRGKPLFPSESVYSVYGGSCRDNSPGSDPNATFVNIRAGAYQNAGRVRLPSYDVRVMSGTSVLSPGQPLAAKVVFFAGCGASYERTTVAGSALDGRAGRLEDPGFPYTTAGSVCISASRPEDGGRTWRYTRGSIANTTLSGNGSIQTIYLGNVGARGATCTA